jgi:hypothetical protein
MVGHSVKCLLEIQVYSIYRVVVIEMFCPIDTVPHHRLFTKLKGYGISGNIREWIKNFLSERKQKVVLNGSNSKWTDATSRIPQGSVLDDLPFLNPC